MKATQNPFWGMKHDNFHRNRYLQKKKEKEKESTHVCDVIAQSVPAAHPLLWLV